MWKKLSKLDRMEVIELYETDAKAPMKKLCRTFAQNYVKVSEFRIVPHFVKKIQKMSAFCIIPQNADILNLFWQNADIFVLCCSDD